METNYFSMFHQYINTSKNNYQNELPFSENVVKDDK